MSRKVEDLRNEEWKQLSFLKETRSKSYFISNYGRFKSVDKNSGNERAMKSTPTGKGYPKISLKLDGGHESVYLHKAVAQSFVKPKSPDHIFIIHKDYNRSNNSSANILWVTEDEQKEYIKKRAVIYDYKKSTGGGYFKLTAAQVAVIKKALLNGKTRKKMLAKRFGVTSTQIKRIERGENWAHVAPAE